MRNNPVLVVLMFVGLFGLAVLLGYVAGQAFLSPPVPQAARPSRPAPAPSAPPSTPAQPPISLQPAEPKPAEPAPAPEPVQPTPAPAPAPAPAPSPAPAPVPAPAPRPPAVMSSVTYRVQVGAFLRRENAEARVAQLVKDGFDAYINQSGGLFKVQVGAFRERENAEKVADQLRALGYEVLITTTK